MKRADWTLLVLNAAEQPLTPVQLQKCLFLIGKSLTPAEGSGFYEFIHHHYGAFCPDIYADAQLLAQENEAVVNKPVYRNWADYSVSDAGKARATAMMKSVRPGLASYIQAVVHWAQGLSFQQLVHAVYEQYPETKENSVFRS